MATGGQPGYVFRDFCLEQGIDFIIFCLNQGIDFIQFFKAKDQLAKKKDRILIKDLISNK